MHTILTNRLSSIFGISGIALLWIKSYLSSRYFTVNSAGYTSNPQTPTCGVPQGSVLNPLLFILYTSPLELYRYRFLTITPKPSRTDDSNSQYRLCGRL